MPDSDAELQSPDVATRSILALVAGFLVFAAVSIVGLGVYYRHYPAHVEMPPPPPFPAPRLETRNREDLAAILRRHDKEIRSYGWVDREKGLIRIPVVRAMEILAARGAAAYDPPEPASASEPTPTAATPRSPTLSRGSP